MSRLSEIEERLDRFERRVNDLDSRLILVEETMVSVESLEETKAIRIQDKNYEVEFSNFDNRIRAIEQELGLMRES